MALRSFRHGGDEHGRPGWWFAFPYDAGVVDKLKAAIPSYDRRWNPGAKEWWVSAEREQALRRVLPDVAIYLDQPALL